MKVKAEKGYAILELLFYIAFFAVLSILAVNAIIVMAGSFKETAIQRELAQGANIMERVSREIRGAYNISSVGVNNLKLNAKDNLGADKTVEFALSSTDIQFLENNALTGNLNTPNIEVVALTFTQITTAKGKAVKAILSIRSKNDASGRTVDFYDTVALRGSY